MSKKIFFMVVCIFCFVAASAQSAIVSLGDGSGEVEFVEINTSAGHVTSIGDVSLLSSSSNGNNNVPENNCPEGTFSAYNCSAPKILEGVESPQGCFTDCNCPVQYGSFCTPSASVVGGSGQSCSGRFESCICQEGFVWNGFICTESQDDVTDTEDTNSDDKTTEGEDEDNTGGGICPAGTFQSENGCIPCPVGTYQPQVGQDFCLPCEGRGYQDQTGQTFCKTCQDGSKPNQDNTACEMCKIGCPNGYVEGEEITDCAYYDKKPQEYKETQPELCGAVSSSVALCSKCATCEPNYDLDDGICTIAETCHSGYNLCSEVPNGYNAVSDIKPSSQGNNCCMFSNCNDSDFVVELDGGIKLCTDSVVTACQLVGKSYAGGSCEPQKDILGVYYGGNILNSVEHADILKENTTGGSCQGWSFAMSGEKNAFFDFSTFQQFAQKGIANNVFESLVQLNQSSGYVEYWVLDGGCGMTIVDVGGTPVQANDEYMPGHQATLIYGVGKM